MNTMGSRIKQKRLELGLSCEELGSKLGVHRAAVNKWESGEVENIKRSTIDTMSKIFNCSPAWLMGFDSPDKGTTIEMLDSPETVQAKQALRLAESYLKLSPKSQKAIYDLIESLSVNESNDSSEKR